MGAKIVRGKKYSPSSESGSAHASVTAPAHEPPPLMHETSCSSFESRTRCIAVMKDAVALPHYTHNGINDDSKEPSELTISSPLMHVARRRNNVSMHEAIKRIMNDSEETGPKGSFGLGSNACKGAVWCSCIHCMTRALDKSPGSEEPQSPKSPKSPLSPSTRSTSRVLVKCQQCSSAARMQKYFQVPDMALCDGCIKQAKRERVPMEFRPQSPPSPKANDQLSPFSRAIVRNSIRQYERF